MVKRIAACLAEGWSAASDGVLCEGPRGSECLVARVMARTSRLPRCAMPRCSQPNLGPGQCVGPAVQCSRAELPKGRAATASSFGREGLRFNRITSLGEGFGCAVARQQRVRVIGNGMRHRHHHSCGQARSIEMVPNYAIGFVLVVRVYFRTWRCQ